MYRIKYCNKFQWIPNRKTEEWGLSHQRDQDHLCFMMFTTDMAATDLTELPVDLNDIGQSYYFDAI